MSGDPDLARLFAHYVEHHVQHGARLSVGGLCEEQPHLEGPLRQQINRYHDLDRTLAMGEGLLAPLPPPAAEAAATDASDAPLRFEGFQTIERVGRGGMGEVFKARDRSLERTVAIKLLRPGDPVTAGYADFLREARSMALFADRRIVQIHEFRADHDPPFLVMEFVDGFELDRVGPSLEHRQRARIMLDVCEAVHHAHERGIQHRDLKPANILVDSSLRPRILDFGLSGSDPHRGHLVGTLHYMAPEQLDPDRPLDSRTDVHALGVLFYELLCGERPYEGRTDQELLEAIQRAAPRLPVEIDPRLPEPLQAIALKAMEAEPAQRYSSARAMAEDLRRYLEGRPVLARPTHYATALGHRLQPHLSQIDEWQQLKLIYPHEARRLRRAYGKLESRDDDWIVQSRVLSFSQIALYLGAFLLIFGGLLYFGVHRLFEAADGLLQPSIVLAAPFVGLSLAGRWLYRHGHPAVGIAFYLAGILLLPLYLLIVFHETGLLAAAADDPRQLLGGDVVSNRQLQLATLAALCWSSWLALRTRTVGLSSLATLLFLLFGLSVLTDFGLRGWIEDGRWDSLSLHLLFVLAAHVVAALLLERSGAVWFARTLWVASGMLWIAVLELLALDGRTFHYLGLSMARFQAGEVADPVLLDTLAAMTGNGLLIYLSGWLAERRGSRTMQPVAWLWVVVSPFAMLYPAGYLVSTASYSPNYDWLYLALALAITLLSHYRQRKSFYFAGLLNSGVALWLIGDRRDWLDDPAWATSVLGAGLIVLLTGLGLAIGERRRRSRETGTERDADRPREAPEHR